MILQSRKWRMLIRLVTLAVTGLLVLVLVAPASYALQDDTPRALTRIGQLLDRENPVADKYIYASAVPDLTRIVATEGLGTTYYWLLVRRYDNLLLVRADGKEFLSDYARGIELSKATGDVPAHLYGKITPLQGQAGAADVIEAVAERGITLDPERTMVILQGEKPSTYRPAVPAVGLLALLWFLALLGLMRIMRGRPRRRARIA